MSNYNTVKALVLFIFIISSSHAKLHKEVSRSILEVKRTSVKLNTYLRREAQAKSHSLKTDRIKELYYSFYPFYNLSKQLHKKAIVKSSLGYDEEDNFSFDLEIKQLDDYLDSMFKSMEVFISHKNFEYLPSKKVQLIEKISKDLKFLADYLSEEDEYSNKTPLSILEKSNDYQDRIKFHQGLSGDLADFDKKLDTLFDHSKDIYRKYRKWRNNRFGPKNRKIRSRKHRDFSDFTSAITSYRYLVKDLSKELKKSFQSDKSLLSKGYLSTKISVMHDALEEVIYFFNDLDKKYDFSINEKDKLRDLIDASRFLSVELNSIYLSHEVRELTNNIKLTEKVFTYRRATQVCSLLGGPGNILLKRSLEKDIDLYTDFSPRTSGAIKLVEALKFSNKVLDFRHAEVITEIQRDTSITTMGFYPLMFNKGRAEEDKVPIFLEIKKGYRRCDSEGCDSYNDYRTNFAWLKVNASNARKETKKKEKSLKKVSRKEDYSKLGVCSDFVNWTYSEQITSDWNFIPIVKNLIQLVYIPEGYQTPDDLYDSYMTDTVCEVEKRKLTYPIKVNAHELVERVFSDLDSSNLKIKSHAQNVKNQLIKAGILNKEEQLTTDIIRFKKP